MTGLIYKDFLALKGHLTTYLVFFLVYGGLCLSGVFTASVLCGMVVLMSLITPMTTVTSDDVSRWNRFAIATPACRRGVVTGKYLFTLLVTLASTVFVSLLLVVLALAGGLEESLSELLLSALACAGIALIMNAVALPLLLKFGAEKARMVSMALFLLVFAGFALLGLAADRGLASSLRPRRGCSPPCSGLLSHPGRGRLRPLLLHCPGHLCPKGVLSMAGLLCKDWLLLRRQLWYSCPPAGALSGASLPAGVLDASFLCGLAVLYGTLLPTTCFSYDEAVHWERYAAATPAGRRGTVDGKYLLALLLAALSGGISPFLTVLMEGPESALALAVLVCTGLAPGGQRRQPAPSPAVG
ncbi:MAG: ABC-2 transporter permease [Flavonifractor plautii]